jgi:hypothetical protein
MWTVGGAAGFVTLLLTLAVGQAIRNSNVPTPFQRAAENLTFEFEKTPAERLRHPAPELRRRLAELDKVHNDPAFPSLSAEQQRNVREWGEEMRNYLTYLDKLRAERRPADAVTETDLERIKDRLKTQLSLPSPDWQTTEAGEELRNHIKEADALSREVGRVRIWYLDLSEKATGLWTFKGYVTGPEGPGIDWQAWSRQVGELLGPGSRLPFTDTEPLPNAPPNSGLTYAAALRFDKVVAAKADWEADRTRLRRLLDLTAALGLATVPDRPPVLVFPEQCPLELVRARRQELARAYPGYEKEFTLEDLPDAVKGKVRQVAETNYRYVLEPARAVVLRQLQQAGSGPDETPARWDAVRAWLREPEELAAWRVVAGVLARLVEPDAADPVTALQSFLAKPTFTLSLSRVVVVVPDSLKVRPGASAAFNVNHPASGGGRSPLTLEQFGDRERRTAERAWAYAFRLPEEQRITYRPGDALWATLALNDDTMFTWARARSATYQFECLRRPPRLHGKDQENTAGTLQEGVRLTILPEDGVPKVPDLMPVVRLGP